MPTIEEFLDDAKRRMDKSIDTTRTEFNSVRTGRASTALSLCMENALPIHVFELAKGNILRAASGEQVGTVISTPAHSHEDKEG